MHKIGKTFIVSGPSGVGKKHRAARPVPGRDDLYFSVSATTRPREGEQDGVDYHFIQADAFRDMIAADAFLEYAEYVGNFYGTPKMYVDDAMAQGQGRDIGYRAARAPCRCVPNGRRRCVFSSLRPAGMNWSAA